VGEGFGLGCLSWPSGLRLAIECWGIWFDRLLKVSIENTVCIRKPNASNHQIQTTSATHRSLDIVLVHWDYVRPPPIKIIQMSSTCLYLRPKC
jgi:hypothetical protein